MTFTSFEYAIFLPLVFLVFYLTASRHRWLVLLVASYVFYAAADAPHLPVVLALVTVLSYACGILLGRIAGDRGRRIVFWLGTTACVLVWGAMKYLPPLLVAAGVDLPLSRPLVFIGVSYFVIQAISYMADVYLGIQEPEKDLGAHALYLAFFPKLLQGPIERASDLLPQLKKPYRFNYDAMRSGLLLIAYGLFRKLVVADRLAIYVDQVYNDVHAYAGAPLILATYAYALQIYFDFAGYTDMARGTARMFGIDLVENFNGPYLATSVADFWRRWHISFSRWLLDYIFKPLQLGWRHLGAAGTALALIVTFLVSGIWHGASWGFVIWGLLHGVYLAASTIASPYRQRLYQRLGVERSGILPVFKAFVTFHLVCFAWIFFRAETLGDAWYVVGNLFHFEGPLRTHHNFTMILSALAIVLAVRVAMNRARDFMKYPYFRWSVYILLVQVILLCGVHKGDSFVYFKF